VRYRDHASVAKRCDSFTPSLRRRGASETRLRRDNNDWAAAEPKTRLSFRRSLIAESGRLTTGATPCACACGVWSLPVGVCAGSVRPELDTSHLPATRPDSRGLPNRSRRDVLPHHGRNDHFRQPKGAVQSEIPYCLQVAAPHQPRWQAFELIEPSPRTVVPPSRQRQSSSSWLPPSLQAEHLPASNLPRSEQPARPPRQGTSAAPRENLRQGFLSRGMIGT
jgi:hypothetical protein